MKSQNTNSATTPDAFDPFSYQIHRHYKGILGKIDAIDQKSLEEKLQKISQVTKGLEDDQIVKETEDEIRDQMTAILKIPLLTKMTVKILHEIYEAQSVHDFLTDEFPEFLEIFNNLKNGKKSLYTYNDRDYFFDVLHQVGGKNLSTELNFVLTVSHEIFRDKKELKELFRNPNLDLWYQTIDHLLDLYGNKIIEIEAAKESAMIQRQNDYSEELARDQQEAEDNPDSRELDYGDYENSEDSSSGQSSESSNSSNDSDSSLNSESDYSSSSSNSSLSSDRSNSSSSQSEENESETSSADEEFYLAHQSEFSNPSNFANLVAISSNFGTQPLSWLTNQIAEYQQEDLWDYLTKKIISDPQLTELDSDLLEFIIYRASAFNSKVADGEDEEAYHLFNSGSLARDYSDEKLVSGGFVTDAFTKYLSEINREKLSEDVKNEFAYVKEISEKGWLRELQESYNTAHNQNDLVTQNQIWAIFDSLQKNLKTLKFDEKKDPKKLQQLLQKAKEEYKNRTDQYYFRIYPQPETNRLIYSSKNEEKVAVIEMDKILGELEDIGHKITDILKDKTSAKAKDSTNVVVPVLCFVVSNRPHKNDKSQRDHGRIIIPISCDFDVPKYLLSKDKNDGAVSKNDADFFRTAKKDSKYGMEKIKVNSSLAKQDPEPKSQNNELLSHSERTMFEAFRKDANVKKIVKVLHDELRKIYPDELDENDRFKVYSVALLAYSSNSVCQLCSPAIIAHENYTQDSFLTLLTNKLRDFSTEIDGSNAKFFKVRGESNQTKNTQDKIPESIKEKFHLTTVVTSTKPFTTQSEDMCGVGKKHKHQNPEAKIYLKNNAIDLHRHETDKDGKSLQDHYSFYEFSQSNFRKNLEQKNAEPEPQGLNFKFVGKTFMSGSKSSKVSTKKRINELDDEVKTVIEARTAITLKELDKSQFTNR